MDLRFYVHNLPNIFPYIESLKSKNYDLAIFRRFLNFWLFFGLFLGTVVKNAKHKKIAPCKSLNFQQKSIALIFRSLKCVFPKCTFSGPKLNRLGVVWYLLISSKAHAPRGCPANTQVLTRHTTYNIQNVDANTTYDMLMLMSLSNLSMSNIPHPTLHHLPYLPFFVPVQNSANFICPTLVRC